MMDKRIKNKRQRPAKQTYSGRHPESLMRSNEIRRTYKRLRYRMTVYVFIVMCVMMITVLGIIMLMTHFEVLTRKNPFIPLVIVGLSSLTLGAILTALIYRHLFAGFNPYLTAMSRIAKGDFDVEIPESDNYLRPLASSFNAMAQSLKSIDTLKSDFISNFSHEFKTPIASICGFAKLLKDPLLGDEERSDYINIIIAESNRLTHLAQNTLWLSKLENQERVFEKKHYPLDEQIRTCALLFMTELEAKNIELDMSETEIAYYGNETLLSQLWINIFSNCIKFTPAGGKITASLSENSGQVTVQISDSGCGMSEETREHIFEKFYQCDNSRSTSGNGLGMSIAKKIVDINNGTITVQSALGQGSSFIITLPKGA